MRSSLIYSNREIINNIHFCAKSSSNARVESSESTQSPIDPVQRTYKYKGNKEKEPNSFNSLVRSRMIKSNLRDLFAAQHPNETFSLSRYRILNWPHEVNLKKPHWTNRERELILRNISDFKFILKPFNEYRMEEEYGVVLEYGWTQNMINLLILQRFRDETGAENAGTVQWNLLDRSKIPLKYDKLVIDESTMSDGHFYKNPEIVHNIHFHRAVCNKRKYSEIEIEADLNEFYESIFMDEDEKAS